METPVENMAPGEVPGLRRRGLHLLLGRLRPIPGIAKILVELRSVIRSFGVCRAIPLWPVRPTW
jgi:hypothetical protein